MEKKSKEEQLFVLLAMLIAFFSFICLVGCGGKKSCETPKCGISSEQSANSLVGCSVPGCGGLLTSGEGCGSCCLWSQSIAISGGVLRQGKEQKYMTATVADIYYVEKNSFMGCSTYRPKACYGTVAVQNPTTWMMAAGSNQNELMINCGVGDFNCIGCTDGLVFRTIAVPSLKILYDSEDCY